MTKWSAIALIVGLGLLVVAGCAGPAHVSSTTSKQAGARESRHSVGLKSTSHPFLVATITGVTVHRPRPPALARVTVAFTVGELGKTPGTGVPAASAFSILLTGKTPSPGNSPPLVSANGAHGDYSATTLLPPGGISGIQIGGFVANAPPGSAADGEYWLPVNAFRPGE